MTILELIAHAERLIAANRAAREALALAYGLTLTGGTQ